MAASTSLAAPSPISGADLERAGKFAREPFLHEGEDPETTLAEGTPRRRALDRALAELDAGRSDPSVAWRREFSLMLGLERMLSEDEPHLVDGTLLSAHQVDALSGTLIALLAEAQNGARGNGSGANGAQGAENRTDGEPASSRSTASKTAVPAATAMLGGDVASDANGASPETEADRPDDEGELDGEAPEVDESLPDEEEPVDWETDPSGGEEEEEASAETLDDPGAARRFWFEHATGAGKTVAALGFAEASRTGGMLILTHRRNLVEQFNGELVDRGYKDRISPPLFKQGSLEPPAKGPVTVETYQWFVRNAGKISDAYTIVICDEAHTALGEKTSAAIRSWRGPIFIGMTATGALIARHVTDLFPTQTSRFDLAQAARRGVIAPLRGVRIPPGVGVNTIAKVPLRKGEVDQDFDLEELAALLDQGPFNAAVADLYRVRFRNLPGVVYSAGVRHAHNVAQAFRDAGMQAVAVSGETPKRELTSVLAAYERGEIDVLINAQLLAEGWNSPRATVCMHLAPTASKRIYQQRVGRVTRRQPGKEAGIVVDFVHPSTPNDDPVVTLHGLLDRDVYRGGAIVVGPVRRGRGRRLRVERRVVPVAAEPERRYAVFERELWRIAVENLPWVDQHAWAALAGARVASNNWRRAKAMLQFDKSGELRRRFLLTCLQRNRNTQLRLRALAEIPELRDADAFTEAVDIVGTWSRDERREGVKILLGALAERQVGRRDQAASWIWDLAGFTREVHEEYAAQRWPETKRLLGLLVNSSGAAHGRNARRLVHQARSHDRRLCAALLAAAVGHTPEAVQVLTGARTRMARKPSSLARELLRNFPKGRRRRGGRRRKRPGGEGGDGAKAGSNAKGAAAGNGQATEPAEAA
jgi:superfamily II DNA or RNA helicase